MFHAMAWGLPYAAFLSGASLLMPDRFLQAAPLAAMIAAERPTLAGAVPTIWTDLLAYLDANPTDTSSMREVIVGGSACPPALMHAFSERHGIEIIHAWGMTEMSPLGSVSRAAGRPERRRRPGPTATPRAGCRPSVEARIVGPDGVGDARRRQVRRASWRSAARGSPQRYIGDAEPGPGEVPRTAGCAPATSACSRRTAT